MHHGAALGFESDLGRYFTAKDILLALRPAATADEVDAGISDGPNGQAPPSTALAAEQDRGAAARALAATPLYKMQKYSSGHSPYYKGKLKELDTAINAWCDAKIAVCEIGSVRNSDRCCNTS